MKKFLELVGVEKVEFVEIEEDAMLFVSLLSLPLFIRV